MPESHRFGDTAPGMCKMQGFWTRNNPDVIEKQMFFLLSRPEFQPGHIIISSFFFIFKFGQFH